MSEVVDAANNGMPVLGICNGFQMLTEAICSRAGYPQRPRFLPAATRCCASRTRRPPGRAVQAGQEITIPLKNGEGGFIADDETLDRLEGEGRVVFRYVGVNPNGSLRDIAGISNDRGNVGLMPTRARHRARLRPRHAAAMRSGVDGLGVSRASCSTPSSRRSAASPARGVDCLHRAVTCSRNVPDLLQGRRDCLRSVPGLPRDHQVARPSAGRRLGAQRTAPRLGARRRVRPVVRPAVRGPALRRRDRDRLHGTRCLRMVHRRSFLGPPSRSRWARSTTSSTWPWAPGARDPDPRRCAVAPQAGSWTDCKRALTAAVAPSALHPDSEQIHRSLRGRA